MKKSFLLAIFLTFSCAFGQIGGFENWEQWKEKCLIPDNPELDELFKYGEDTPVIDVTELTEIIFSFLETSFIILSDHENWLGKEGAVEKEECRPTYEIECLNSDYGEKSYNTNFEFIQKQFNKKYAQKLVISSEAKILSIGDLHGNFNALCNIIDNWILLGYLNEHLKVQDDRYIVTLGDYVSRGMSGTEVLATLMLLKIINPDRVFLCRGNHERRGVSLKYGFFGIYEIFLEPGELEKKYVEYHEMLTQLFCKVFETMATVIYVENPFFECKKFAQFNHAGIEERFDPRQILSSNVQFQKINIEGNSGFEWSNIEKRLYRPKKLSRRCVLETIFDYSVKKACKILKKQKVSFKIGGHQHRAVKKINKSEENIPEDGTIDIGTKECPIIITIAGDMYNGKIKYHPTYVIIKPDPRKESSWSWKSVCAI